MPILKKEEWGQCVAKNNDPYGKACIDVARRVMEILDEDQTPLHDGYNPDPNTPHGIICKADKDVSAGGITGFMAGCVAQMVSQFHSRGEEFRKIWNKPYLNEWQEDKGGVVNPAILTLDMDNG